MSVCNCDGTVSVSLAEKIFGDSVLSNLNISENSFSLFSGGTDPRPIACQEAVDQLRATLQDPCNLDSPGDLDVYYKQFLPQVWKNIQLTAASNPLQKAFDIFTGSATPATPVSGEKPKSSMNWTFILGAVLILAVGFILVFR